MKRKNCLTDYPKKRIKKMKKMKEVTFPNISSTSLFNFNLRSEILHFPRNEREVGEGPGIPGWTKRQSEFDEADAKTGCCATSTIRSTARGVGRRRERRRRENDRGAARSLMEL